MQDNINTIITNSLDINKENLRINIKEILKLLKESILSNKDLILDTNKIDSKNNNGFIMDFNIVNNIISNLEKETILFGTTIISKRNDKMKLIYGQEVLEQGNVIVINDGNPYIIIELAIRNILTGNTTIFSNTGYMYGTNQLIIKLIQDALEKLNISKYLLQLFITEEFNTILSNFANIDLVICIGNNTLQRLVLNKSKNKTLISGYENFDLYIEDTNHLDLLNSIINSNLNIQLYINKNTNIDYKNAILVDDLEEAIAQINYNGSKYSSAIFTTSKENASKFIKEVKSKTITINTSPTIERLIDIKQEDLVIIKNVIYPLTYTFTSTINID